MISSAPSAAREKPFVSGRNSVKQAGGHTDLGATDSPLRDGFRSPQLAGLNQGGDRPTSMRLGCEPVGGVRPGIPVCGHPGGRDGVAGALEAIALARPPVSRVVRGGSL
jgi:hypothetical protein